MRWKTLGHLPTGFPSMEEAHKWVESVGEFFEVPLVMEWTGEGTPAMTTEFSDDIYQKALSNRDEVITCSQDSISEST